MSKTHISQTFLQTLQLQNLQNAIAQTENKTHLKGLVGSSFSIIVSEVFKTADKPFLLVFPVFPNDFKNKTMTVDHGQKLPIKGYTTPHL